MAIRLTKRDLLEHPELAKLFAQEETSKPKPQATSMAKQSQPRITYYTPPTTREIVSTSLGYVGDILRSKKITDTVVSTADLVRYLLNQWE